MVRTFSGLFSIWGTSALFGQDYPNCTSAQSINLQCVSVSVNCFKPVRIRSEAGSAGFWPAVVNLAEKRACVGVSASGSVVPWASGCAPTGPGGSIYRKAFRTIGFGPARPLPSGHPGKSGRGSRNRVSVCRRVSAFRLCSRSRVLLGSSTGLFGSLVCLSWFRPLLSWATHSNV